MNACNEPNELPFGHWTNTKPPVGQDRQTMVAVHGRRNCLVLPMIERIGGVRQKEVSSEKVPGREDLCT